LQCLKDNAKTWGWSQKRLDKVGEKFIIVPTPRDLWLTSDSELLDNDLSKFGEATITSEVYPFNLDSIGVSYRVVTEKHLFKHDEFVRMSVLKAICKFVHLVDMLNCRSIEKTGKPKYYVPGLEAHKFFFDNGDKVPHFMRNGSQYYYYVASNFRYHDGSLDVPCSHWNGSDLHLIGDYVSNSWSPDNRFLVLEVI
jgi:hypothetical protein